MLKNTVFYGRLSHQLRPMSFRAPFITFAILLVFFVHIPAQTLPLSLQNGGSDLTLTSLNPASDKKSNIIPFAALETFVDVFDAIKRYYVVPVSNEVLIENAIRGMLTRLDPHSTFMNDEEYHAFEEQSEGSYAGIGVALDIRSGSIRVVSAIAGSPAARAGIRSGDIIIQVDGQSIAELNLAEIDKLFTGEPGSKVTLLIQRDTNMTKMELIREIIHTNSVSSKMLTQDLAYLRISQFQEDTAEALAKEIESLRVKYHIAGAIIDLRDNPGGLLESAVASADLFLDQGSIVSVRGRAPDNQEIYNAKAGDILSGTAIVVLVNRGSASAAEILAGALKDNHRALIVGTRTFGKGSVQTVTRLYHGGAIKQTTARYYTPSGKSIQAIGITPQIRLARLRLNRIGDDPVALGETTLSNHLENSDKAPAAPQSDNAGLAQIDFPLYEALNILQALRTVASADTAAPEKNAARKQRENR